MTKTSFRDVELLSAFLDGALSPSESARLEARLKSEPALTAVLDDLRTARGVLRGLPPRRAPRNFTLTPKMAGVKPPIPRSYPVLRFASALATVLLFFTFAVNLISMPLAFGAAAPAEMPYGAGGGGADSAAEAPAAEPSTELQAVPTLDAADATRIGESATPATMEKGFAQTQADQDSAGPPHFTLQTGLLIAALVTGAAAWFVRLTNDQKWRTRK